MKIGFVQAEAGIAGFEARDIQKGAEKGANKGGWRMDRNGKASLRG
jgi:hypothetical protein